MVCKIGGRRVYLWRAVDDEGEVLEGEDAVCFDDVLKGLREKSRVGGNVVGARMKWAKSYATIEVLAALREMGWSESRFGQFERGGAR